MTRAEQSAKKARQVQVSCPVCGGRYMILIGHDPGSCGRTECVESVRRRKAAKGSA